MPLFLMGCFPMDFQEVKRPLRTKSAKRPIKVGKRPINEGKRPIKAKVLVGVSVGCLMGCFRAPPPWRKTAPLKRPIKRSMKGAMLEIPESCGCSSLWPLFWRPHGMRLTGLETTWIGWSQPGLGWTATRGNGRNTVSKVLFRRRELNAPH